MQSLLFHMPIWMYFQLAFLVKFTPLIGRMRCLITIPWNHRVALCSHKLSMLSLQPATFFFFLKIFNHFLCIFETLNHARVILAQFSPPWEISCNRQNSYCCSCHHLDQLAKRLLLSSHWPVSRSPLINAESILLEVYCGSYRLIGETKSLYFEDFDQDLVLLSFKDLL